MNGESTYKPNFTVVDNGSASEPKPEIKNNTTLNDDTDFEFSPSEKSLINKKRHKLRIFDPEGIYTFRHIEIGYFHSFSHVISLLIALFLIIGFYYFVITDTQQLVTGIGRVSDINVLDKLCMSFIAIYGLVKIKKTLTTKVTKFDIRYRIALCANSLNRIILNYLKLTFFCLAIILTIMQVYYPDKTVNTASSFFENGVIADSLSIVIWLICIIIVIKAFKYCGKGDNK